MIVRFFAAIIALFSMFPQTPANAQSPGSQEAPVSTDYVSGKAVTVRSWLCAEGVNDCYGFCERDEALIGGGCDLEKGQIAPPGLPIVLFNSKIKISQIPGFSKLAYVCGYTGNAKHHVQTVCMKYFPRAGWSLSGAGDLFALAQSGPGLKTNIDLDFIVCNDKGSVPATVRIFHATDKDTKAFDPIQLPMGKCLAASQPSAIFISNNNGQDSTISGFYQAFQKGTFSSEPAIVDLNLSNPDQPPPPGTYVEANCVKTTTPNPFSNCVIPNLIKGMNYRICFDDKYTPPQPKVQDHPSYPGTYTPMVLTPELMSVPVPPSTPEFTWTPIKANICRDIYNFQFAGFLVAPTNSPDYWQPELVTKIMMTIQTLP